MGSARLLVVGGGRMGEALVSGLVRSGWAPAADIAVAEVVEDRRAELAERIRGLTIVSEPCAAEGVVIVVKPADAAAATEAAVAAGAGRVLSIAAGVQLATLQDAAGPGVPVVRAMPNTPALVGAGVAAISAGDDAGEDDMAWAESILGAVGDVVRVPEPLLAAVTGLSGSGPAYVFLVVEALVEGGVLAGLPRDVSARLAAGTVLGAARLLAESSDGPEALRAAVTSPGGTTAAGLRELERAGARAAFIEAVMASAERSRELG